jgi:uncharacterized protein (TIGR03083 family)
VPVEPDDARRAAAFVVAALEPGVEADWSVPAGTLEWDVRFTVVHMAGAPAKYAVVLAARASSFMPLRLTTYDDETNAGILDMVRVAVDALAHVAATVGPDARAFHREGMADAEGLLALACVEVLVHGGDVAAGLSLDYAPPDDLCDAVVDRLVPDVPRDRPGWRRMLAATGRDGGSNDWTFRVAPVGD